MCKNKTYKLYLNETLDAYINISTIDICSFFVLCLILATVFAGV